jgi:hypothetical protein
MISPSRFLVWAILWGALPPASFAAEPGPTATLAPADPVIGVTKVTITGLAGAGHEVTDHSTYPDGTVHRFSTTADATGAYADGPFLLQQIGTYHDVVRDEATGASTMITYSGSGDFDIAADPAEASVVAGAEVKIKVKFSSIAGYAGWVSPRALNGSDVPGAVLSWSLPTAKLPSGGTASASLTILTLLGTPPGRYALVLEGSGGGVAHRPQPLSLTVTGPPRDAITATFHPRNPIVGVTEGSITGTASSGEWLTDTSTFPDGTVHGFVFKSTGAGTYTDGPFVLKQLGTYHDLLTDGGTGGTVAIAYQGVGDFSATVDPPERTASPGQEVQFLVTFKGLSGFVGTVAPAVPNLAELPGATATWSASPVGVRSGVAPVSSRLRIELAGDTPPGLYHLTVQGTNGSVSRSAAPGVSLTVTAP